MQKNYIMYVMPIRKEKLFSLQFLSISSTKQKLTLKEILQECKRNDKSVLD